MLRDIRTIWLSGAADGTSQIFFGQFADSYHGLRRERSQFRGVAEVSEPPGQKPRMQLHCVPTHRMRLTSGRGGAQACSITETTGGSRKSALLTHHAAMRSSLTCLLYTSDAADDLLCVDLGGR